MAFSPEELVTLGDIVGLDPVALDAWLDGITLSPEVEAAIQADILFYNENYLYGEKVSIEPNEKNFGARIDGDEVYLALVARTRTRLQMPAAAYASGYGTIQIGL